MEFSTVNEFLLPDGSVDQIDVGGLAPIWVRDKFDYGDGHLNTVKGGYNGILYSYSNIDQQFTKVENTPSLYGFGGNVQVKTATSIPNFWNDGSATSFGKKDGVAGTNYYPCNIDGTNKEYTVSVRLDYGSYTQSVSVGNLLVRANGAVYSLKQCVNLKIIKPIVLFLSGSTGGPYYFTKALNLYDNNAWTDTQNFPSVYIYFMLNKRNKIDQIQYDASKAHASGYHDGIEVMIQDTDICRLCLQQN